MRGNWRCALRPDKATVLGVKDQLAPEALARVIHARNTSREAAISAALYELLPPGLRQAKLASQRLEELIDCEPDISDWAKAP